MYEIGEYIVKPVNGVCKVEDILHLDIEGADKNKLYYMLIPVENEKEKIYLSTDIAESRTRRAMTKREACEFIDRISEIEEIRISNEKLREQRYKEAIRSSDPEALIGIIKRTYLRKKERTENGKKTTVVDERYFKLAEKNLFSELEIVLGKNKEEIHELIADAVNKKEK